MVVKLYEAFSSTNLEQSAIFPDISMNFQENFYQEIKTILPEFNGEFF